MDKKGDSNTEQMKDLKNDLLVLSNENKKINSKLEEIIASTKFMSDMYDENVSNMKDIKSQLLEIKNQNKILLQENAVLKKEIIIEKKERIEMEQRFFNIVTPIELERREKNLELHGLPEKKEEDCDAVVKSVLKTVVPGPLSIAKCYRFGKKDNGKEKPRRILIQFSTKEQRENVYKNKSNLKKIEGGPLFLNENLPIHLSILRGKANAKRKEKNYKYIWMKNGTILLRKDEFSDVISIRYSFDLHKIV